MSIVAVVGASLLGGSITHRLAAHGGVREVRLIDSLASVAQGTALDIQQSGPVEGFDTVVVGDGTIHDVVGADIVILAGPAGGEDLEWSESDGLTVVEHVARLNRRALLVCAGGTHLSLVERAVAAGVSRRQIIGSAPTALAAAVRAIVALELGCSPNDISLGVLGRPPRQLVIPWSEASARGVTIPKLMEPRQLSHLQHKVLKAWPLGPYALAAGTAHLCRSVIQGTGDRGCPCYAVLDGEWGVRNRAVAVSALLDESGVSQVLEPVLSARERTQLESALRPQPEA